MYRRPCSRHHPHRRLARRRTNLRRLRATHSRKPEVNPCSRPLRIFPVTTQPHVWIDLRADLRGLFVGERTVGDSFLAPIAFVAVNALTGLIPAVVAALLVGAGVALWRVRKGQKVSFAIGGILAIGFAAVLALRSGRAESFFLPGIVGTALLAAASVLSMIARRPLAAWSSWAQRRWPIDWYWRPDVRPAYTEVTGVWAIYFGARAGLEWYFYLAERPAALAAAKLLTSWPTILPLLVATYVYGNRRLGRLGGPSVAEFKGGLIGPFAGGQRGF